MSSSSTTTSPDPVTDSDLTDVRILIEDALVVYANTPAGQQNSAGGVTAEDLADNVHKWTHTTRLRDFVEGVRKAAV